MSRVFLVKAVWRHAIATPAKPGFSRKIFASHLSGSRLANIPEGRWLGMVMEVAAAAAAVVTAGYK